MQCLPRAEVEAVLYVCLVGGGALSAQYLCPAVPLVAEERVADVLHVGSYLMCAACLEHAFHEGGVAVFLHHLPVCDGGFAYVRAGRRHGHAQAVLGVAGDVALYASAVFGKVSPDEAVVGAVCVVVEELFAEA